MARTVDFSDGFESSSSPTAGEVEANQVKQFANDAAFVSDKGSAAAAGDLYYHTGNNKLRVYDAGDTWKDLPYEIEINDAAEIVFDPTVNGSLLVSTDVQGAIDENTDKIRGKTISADPTITGQVLSYNSVSGEYDPTEQSGGGGGVNYITNSTFDVDASGYAAYADAALAIPVDGTGGSPTVTLTRTVSTPLRGPGSGLITKDASSRIGEGGSYDFTIDEADKSKNLVIDFDYSGSADFAVNSGTAADPSDIMAYIYDVTNAEILTPILLGLDGSGRFVSSFLAASDSTSYRLIFHVATANALAWTFKFDRVSVGPSAVVTDSSVTTDWQTYTPTGTWTTNTTYTGSYRRVGDSIEVTTTITLAGAPDSVGLEFDLPLGLTMDSNKIALDTHDNLGQFYMNDNGSATNRVMGFMRPNVGNNSVYFLTGAGATLGGSSIDENSPITFASGDDIRARYVIPISGWGTGQETGVAVDSTRPVYARYNTTSQSIPNVTVTILQADTKEYDSHAAVTTGAAWKFTAPVSGIYNFSVSAQTTTSTSWTVGETMSLRFHKNGSQDFIPSSHETEVSNASIRTLNASIDYQLNAGDYIDARVYQAQGGAVNFNSYISVHKTDTGSPLAALSTVNKYQEKILSADVTTAVEATDLTFNNLVVGKWYKYGGQIHQYDNGGNMTSFLLKVEYRNGSTVIGSGFYQWNETATIVDNLGVIVYPEFIFKATETTAKTVVTVATTARIVGNGTKTDASFMTLTELNDYQETTDFT